MPEGVGVGGGEGGPIKERKEQRHMRNRVYFAQGKRKRGEEEEGEETREGGSGGRWEFGNYISKIN